MFITLLFVAAQIVTPPSGPSLVAPGGNMAPPAASVDATFATIATEAGLPNSRKLQNGAGIGFVDGGAGGSLTISNTGETSQSCQLDGGSNCQLTGQFRAAVTSPLPGFSFHGSDGWGTATSYGMGKVAGNLNFYADSTTNPSASFNRNGTMILASAQAGNPRYLECYDGGVADYCQFLTTSAGDDFLDIDAQVRANFGSLTLAAYAFDGVTDAGLYYAPAGNGAPIVYNNSGDAGVAASINASLVAISGTASVSGNTVSVSASAGQNISLTAGADVRMQAMTGVLAFPASVSATPTTTLPTCNSGNGGAARYIDDTNDAKPGVMCYCVGDETDTFTWRGLAYNSVGGWVAGNCPP